MAQATETAAIDVHINTKGAEGSLKQLNAEATKLKR